MSQRIARGLSLLALLLLPALVPPRATDSLAPAARERMVAVPGPLAATAVRALVKHADLLGDFGGFGLALADARGLQDLRDAGLDPQDLGAWPEGRELLVRRPHGDHELAPAERIFAAGGAELLAVAPGVAQAGAGCHDATLVPRTPVRAGRGFRAPPGAQQVLLAADPRVAALVAQVEAAPIEAATTQLASWFTRRADSATVLQARDWLVAQAAAIPGVQVSTESFNPAYGPNVVATLPGSVHPERMVVLGAHYDSINLSGSALAAPGADDNASGSAGLLEALAALAQGEHENTVRCVWFCAEELGLLGSAADAAQLAAAGTEVVAMLNMDMIAYRAAGDALDLDFATNSTDPALVQFCRDAAATYVPALPTVTGVLTAGSSDHASYNAQGFPAAFFFEDLGQYSPVIHTSGDTLGASANDWVLAQRITQAFVAAAATLASPVDLSLAHAPLGDTADAGGPYPLEVEVASLTGAGVAAVEAFVSVDGGPSQSVALLPGLQAGHWVGSLPGVQPSGEVRYWLQATDGDGFTQWLPQGFAPGDESWGFTVGVLDTAWSSDFEGPSDGGWTHLQLATQDDWQRGTPAGKSGDPSAAFSGSSAWANDLGGSGWNGAYASNVHNRLESPAISTLGKTGLHLRMRRWLGVEDGLYDQATILVNGTPVWTNPATPGGSAHLVDTAWTLQDLDLGGLADDQPALRLRFELESDGGLEFGGWTLDDLALARLGPGTVVPLTASALHLSAAQGGSLSLQLDAGPAFAGRKYLLLVSASGSAPGTPLGGVLLPLNLDLVSSLALANLNTPVFAGFAGLLSAQGTATATFLSPPFPDPLLPGVTLSFAAITLGPIDFASNAVGLQYQP